MYKYTPTRRSGPFQRRDYLNRIVDLAARSNIAVYLENKELFFHDIFLELNPQLTKHGAVCPNEPFWWEFVRTKYTELFEDIPGIAGIITAPATRESRLSILGRMAVRRTGLAGDGLRLALVAVAYYVSARLGL